MDRFDLGGKIDLLGVGDDFTPVWPFPEGFR